MDNDHLEAVVIGLMNEMFTWLSQLMPEDFDFKEAYKRIDRVFDESYD